jgi:hypothetical protein
MNHPVSLMSGAFRIQNMNPSAGHISAPTDGPLCQVDRRHGCSACCGLFNFKDISEESLTAFLRSGPTRTRLSGPAPTNPEASLPPGVRDMTSWICPSQGFLPGDTKPGCLYHPSLNSCPDGDLRDRSLFGARICGEYFCPAHAILEVGMRSMLIACTDGWYPYTIGIIDPDSFRWIAITAGTACEASGRRGNTHSCLETAISKSLRMHGAFLNSIGSPVFHYSMEEYRRCSRAYSLTVESPHQRKVLEMLHAELSGTSA